MMRHTLLLLALMLVPVALRAQVADTSRWDVHLSAGSSVAAGFGKVQSLSWVAPSFEFHPTRRLTVNTGFVAAGSLMPTDYKLQGFHTRSLAPMRSGTRATALWAEAEYQVNSRLWLWGSVAHVNGFAQPLWLDSSLPLQATVIRGGAGYRFGENSILELHINVVHDHYGTLAPLLYDDPFSYNRFF